MVRVKYIGKMSKFTNVKEEEFTVNNLKELLEALKKMYGKEVYKIAKGSNIVINEQFAGDINGFNTKLNDGDIVKFFPVCCGG